MEDGPFGPWRSASTTDELTEAASRPLVGHWLDEYLIIYDEAFAKGGALPDDVDRQSIVNVAAMLGRNRAIPRDPWPENAPDIQTIRKSYWMGQGKPAPKRDVPVDDDEYRILHSLASGGKRKGT